MATIQSSKAPSSRIEAGNLVLAASETVDTTPIKKRLATFKQAHTSYAAAEAVVRTAEEKLRKAEANVGERDADQDEAVDALANALILEGESRTNAFKSFGFAPPGAIKILPYADEAKTIRKLVTAVRKRSGLSKDVQAATTVVEKAAVTVETAIETVKPFQLTHSAALAKREALALPWEKAFAALKRGARAAEDEGATDLFAMLFQQNATPSATPKGLAKRGAKKAAKQRVAEAKRAGKESVAIALARVKAAEEALGGARSELAAAKEAVKRARDDLKAAPRQAALAAGGTTVAGSAAKGLPGGK